MTAAEVANVLATSEGAIKSALHRARGRLRSVEPVSVRKLSSTDNVTTQFLALFEAQNFDGLVDLFAQEASAENVGNSIHFGRESERGYRAVLRACMFGHPEWPKEFQRDSLLLEPIECAGETALLAVQSAGGEQTLASVFRRMGRRIWPGSTKTWQPVSAQRGWPRTMRDRESWFRLAPKDQRLIERRLVVMPDFRP